MSDSEIYWFARGYHDGRVVGAGVEEGIEAVPNDKDRDANRFAYRRGYDCGVTDYCELDTKGDNT